METDKVEQIVEQLIAMVTVYGLKILAALAIFIVGRIVAGAVSNGVRRTMERGNTDPTLVGFVANLARFAILAFTMIAVLGRLGVHTASFVAVVGAAGLAIGLALQGSLSNFASGVLLLIFRPIKIGDFVAAGGTKGTVKEIGIFTTVLHTPDNKKIICPNSQVTGGTITNYSANDTRRVDLGASIGYGDDIAKAKSVLERIVNEHQLVLKDPAPQVELRELADSSVNFVVQPWVKRGDYWRVYSDITESIKIEFDKEGISIPFPQQDVHMHQASAS